MKRTLFGRTLNKTFLAVPAAAMMLGVSQAQTTIGINFAGGAYANLNNFNYAVPGNPTSYGGFPVTATAFGVAPADWNTTTNGNIPSFPYSYSNPGSIVVGPANSLNVNWTSADCWGTYIGADEAVTNSAGHVVPPPGNDEVTWAFLDTGSVWNVGMSGLNANFPHGYVIQAISASGGTGTKLTTSSFVNITDGQTFTNSPGFNPIYSVDNGFGIVGLQVATNLYTSDAITMTMGSSSCSLCGFILTDEPVVSYPPASGTNNEGSSLVLNAGAIGVPPLSYQWRFNGIPIPGATAASYTNFDLVPANAGNYDVVVTNLYGTTTSSEAAITVNQQPVIGVDLPSAITNFSTMSAAFSPVAGGAPPLDYSWTKDGSPLENTNGTLILTNLQVSDAGEYQVVVTNAYGSVTSSVVTLTVLSSPPPADGFAYSTGNLNGQNGGTGGWSGAWIQPTNYDGDNYGGGHEVVTPFAPWEGTLSQLSSTGSGLQLAAVGTSDYSDIRNLQTTLGGNGYGTVYMSFVAQVTNNTWGGVELVKDGSPSLFLGECWEGSDWGWGSRGSPDAKSTISPTVYSLLVYRFDYTPTNTAVRLYVNPSSLSVEPTNATVSGTEPSIVFDQISIVTHGAYGTGTGPDGLLGELRLGGTWASVTPYIARTNLPPLTVQLTPGGVIQDTKPVGTLYDGLSYGTTWLASSGPDFNGITFDGVQQFVGTNDSQITVAPETAFDTTNGTISFWMQYNLPSKLPGPGNGAAMLFDRRTTAGIVITLNSSSGSIQFQQVNNSTGGYAATTVGNTDVADGDWHNVVITYDQSTNGVVAIYVDGVLDTSSVNSGPWSWPTNQEIELGRSHDSYWYLYNGQMTDFRLYNQILTLAEISDMGTPATSGDLENTNALVLRYSFANDSSLFGQSVVWPYGTLISSPTLGASAVWTAVTNASGPVTSPLPIIPSKTVPAMFYRVDAGIQ